MPRNVVGAPVRNDDFWGREDDVSALWELLDRGNVLLAAPRRYGKTSLMFALADKPLPGWHVVQLDLEAYEHPIDLFSKLLLELIEIAPLANLVLGVRDAPQTLLGKVTKLIEEFGVAGFKLKLRETVRPDEWLQLGESVIERLDRADKRVLLIFDEFPLMVGTMLDKDPALATRFLNWFRARRTARSHNQVRFLLGGSVNIEPRLEALHLSAQINDLERFHIEPFPDAVAVRFVEILLETELAGRGEAVPERTAEKMVETARSGAPYFLQALVNEYLVLHRQLHRPIALQEIDELYRQRLLGPKCRNRFIHYVTRIKEYYGSHADVARVVLDELSQKEPQSAQGLEMVLANRGFASGELESVLVRLEGDYYIERRGDGICFSDGILRDWWRENVPPPHAPSGS